MDGQCEPQWSAASRTAGFNRRDYRCHSAGHLCSTERFPDALWDRGSRNAFRVVGDSQHAPSLSQSHHERAIIELAHASVRPPVLTLSSAFCCCLQSQSQPSSWTDCDGRFRHFLFSWLLFRFCTFEAIGSRGWTERLILGEQEQSDSGHHMVEASKEVYRLLHQRFKGDLLRPGESGYEEARVIWNGMVARRPDVIARCADVSDVQSAIRAASGTRNSHRGSLWRT